MACTRTAISARAWLVNATSPSIPAVLRPVLRCVTWRTLTSVLCQLRSISFCRSTAAAMSLSCTALKILLRSRRTSSSQRRQSTRSQASPSKAGNTGRGSSGPFTEVSNLSFGSGICFRFASKAHQPTSASFRTRAPARYPASYTKTTREEFPVLRPLTSCCLSAAGIRFLSTLSCQGIQPPLRSAYRTACAYPRLRCGPMARFPRSARVRPRPGRALSVPREQRCSPATLHPRPPPAASQRLVPATPATQPSPERELDEASARVSW